MSHAPKLLVVYDGVVFVLGQNQWIAPCGYDKSEDLPWIALNVDNLGYTDNSDGHWAKEVRAGLEIGAAPLVWFTNEGVTK